MIRLDNVILVLLFITTMNANQLIILLNICTYHKIGYNNLLTMQLLRKNNCCRLKIMRKKNWK